MSPFLRIGFSSFEMDPGLAYHEEVLSPYCAVYMKEAIDTGGRRLVKNMQCLFDVNMTDVLWFNSHD